MTATRDDLVARLARIDTLQLTGDDADALAGSFSPDYVIRRTGGENNAAGMRDFAHSLRAAFDDRTIRHDVVIVENDTIACQTRIAGTFMREFTHSPVGPVPPTGRRVEFEVMRIIRFDDVGRIAEEWVSADMRSLLRQLGVE